MNGYLCGLTSSKMPSFSQNHLCRFFLSCWICLESAKAGKITFFVLRLQSHTHWCPIHLWQFQLLIWQGVEQPTTSEYIRQENKSCNSQTMYTLLWHSPAFSQMTLLTWKNIKFRANKYSQYFSTLLIQSLFFADET